ncbi:MAG: hypothetical protein ACKO96_38730, partial [Flammeovirgaceae bacterium]
MLKKGAEPDLKTVAKILLMDWQRGKIPYFVPPPSSNPDELMSEGVENNNVYEKIKNSLKLMNKNTM